MTAVVRSHAQNLLDQGYTLLEGITSDEEAAEALRPFGDLIPQYDGNLRYQVKAAPGFENWRYSKSTNTILVHTEAPGWAIPPKYLALHCRTQATCGSGHTELADGRAFLAGLGEAGVQAVRQKEISWPGHNKGGTGSAGVRSPVVGPGTDDREIIRFSYNLLTAGHYDPPIDAAPDPAGLPLGRLGVDLAEQAVRFFREQKVSILVPENCILVWDNQRMLHARSEYRDVRRHLTRYWLAQRS